MGGLCWSELAGTQGMFVIAPALALAWGGGRLEVVSAMAGFAVGAMMLLLAKFAVGRFVTLRRAMLAFFPMAAGYALLAAGFAWWPPLREFYVGIGILVIVGLMAVQMSYIKESAPRFGQTKQDAEFVNTGIAMFMTIWQCCGNTVLLCVALYVGTAAAFTTIAVILTIAGFVGLAHSRTVEALPSTTAAAADIANLPTFTRRTWIAALYNLFNAGQVAYWLAPLALRLQSVGLANWGWYFVITALTAALMFAINARVKLNRFTPERRLSLAAAVAIFGLIPAGLVLSTSGTAYAVCVVVGLVISQVSATFGEGAVGDSGAVLSRHEDGTVRTPWTSAQQLTTNSFRAIGFSGGALLYMKALQSGWSWVYDIGWYAFPIAGALIVGLIGLPKGKRTDAQHN